MRFGKIVSGGQKGRQPGDPRCTWSDNLPQIREYLDVDSLHYLSVEGMLSCVKHPSDHYCAACLSGKYPMEVNHPVSKLAFEPYQMQMFD